MLFVGFADMGNSAMTIPLVQRIGLPAIMWSEMNLLALLDPRTVLLVRML